MTLVNDRESMCQKTGSLIYSAKLSVWSFVESWVTGSFQSDGDKVFVWPGCRICMAPLSVVLGVYVNGVVREQPTFNTLTTRWYLYKIGVTSSVFTQAARISVSDSFSNYISLLETCVYFTRRWTLVLTVSVFSAIFHRTKLCLLTHDFCSVRLCAPILHFYLLLNQTT